MADIMTVAQLQEGSQDLETWEVATNGDENTDWQNRTGGRGPSLAKALKNLVGNALLGATAFKTNAAMTASSLADNSYAIVTDDTDVTKNGIYLKQSGVWTYSNYNSYIQSKSAIDSLDINANSYAASIDNVLFAWADADGKIGVTIDNNANINTNNIYSDNSLNYAFAIADDYDNVAFAIDKTGNVILPQFDSIDLRLAALESGQQITDPNALAILSNQKTDFMHFFSYGQSLSRGALAVPVISTTQPYNNVTFKSGVLPRTSQVYDYSGFKPLVEAEYSPDGESPVSGLVNNFVKARVEAGDSADKWVLVGTAPGRGGEPIEDLSKGTPLYDGVLVQVQSAYNLAQAQNKSYSVWALAWTQGEGNTIRSTQAEYYALLNKLHDDFATDVAEITHQKFRPPMVVYQTAGHRHYNLDTMQIALAQLQLANDKPDVILATPIYFLPHAYDDLHLTNDSSYQLGRYYAKALHYTLFSGQKWQPLQPTAIIRQDKIIDVEFSKDNLVFDSNITAINQGFDIWQGITLQDIISSVEIVDKNRVRIILSAIPPAGSELSYARGRQGDIRAKGALRDTAGDNDNYQDSTGTTRYMHNYCVHFSLAI